MTNFDIVRCDFSIPAHCLAQIELLRHYMTDPMGNTPAHDAEGNSRLIAGLKNHPALLSLLACHNGQFVGLTNSFVNFSTFAARPFLNIHDVIVRPDLRGHGVGRKLLEENIRIAREVLCCSKITLEVRADNEIAQHLYQALGFDDTRPAMYFRIKEL